MKITDNFYLLHFMQLSTSIIDNLDQAIWDIIKSKLSHAQQVQFAVWYLFLSGLKDIVDGLEDMEQVQILIGNRTNKNTAITLGNMFEKQSQDTIQTPHMISEVKQETKQAFSYDLWVEFTQRPADKIFLEKLYTLISSGKLQIRIYTKGTFHAKAYIFTAKPWLTKGQCIIWSSNLSKSWFYDNTELNVVVDGDANFEKMQDWFCRLREESHDFTPDLLETMDQSRIKAEPTPYEVYMKVLYELVWHIVENEEKKMEYEIIKDLYQFQLDAVQQAVEIIKSYNGVFVSDVVWLGKTYTWSAILSLLTQESWSKALVLCPAKLQEEWKTVLDKYSINAEVASIDSLPKIASKTRYNKIKYVLIDESHKFKDPNTMRYPLLQEFIHRTDKKLILLSATPLNLNWRDVYHQIKLFHKWEITNLPIIPNHLYQFFQKYEKGETQLSDVLAELMVRRTRLHIKKHYASDMKIIWSFPTRIGPLPIQYDINTAYHGIYDEIESILGQRMDGLTVTERKDLLWSLTDEERSMYIWKLKYAMYDKVSYLKDEYIEISEWWTRIPIDDEFDDIGKVWENLKSLAKIMFYQRLESSPKAFLKTLDRIINYYTLYITNLKNGFIFKTRHSSDLEQYAEIFDTMDEESEEYLSLSDNSYTVSKFDTERYLEDLHFDLSLLETLRQKADILETAEDVKFKHLLSIINQHSDKKILIFSQYSDSTAYLKEQFNNSSIDREVEELSWNTHQQIGTILWRFSPLAQKYTLQPWEKQIDILLATDIIAEWQNLQDAHVVINYDLHRNPVKLIQRIGRIDRIWSLNDTIHIYNFYPSQTGEDKMQLEAKIRERVKAIHQHIWEENQILSPDEELNEKMLQLAEKIKQWDEHALDEIEEITESYEWLFSYAPYIKLLHDCKITNPELYQKVKKMPLRMRTAKKWWENLTLVFCKYWDTDQCFFMDEKGNIIQNKKNFLEQIACDKNTPRMRLPQNHDTKTTTIEEHFIATTQQETHNYLFSSDLKRTNDITALKNKIQNYANEYIDNYDYEQHTKVEEIISFLDQWLETWQKKKFKIFKKIKKTAKFTHLHIDEMFAIVENIKHWTSHELQQNKERYVVISESIL